ncbi:hypothetical protein PMIN05_007778 [Paraphaeosphaeria minitans]
MQPSAPTTPVPQPRAPHALPKTLAARGTLCILTSQRLCSASPATPSANYFLFATEPRCSPEQGRISFPLLRLLTTKYPAPAPAPVFTKLLLVFPPQHTLTHIAWAPRSNCSLSCCPPNFLPNQPVDITPGQ